MKKILYFAIAMFAVISFSACSDEDDNGHTSNNPILVRQCIYTNGDDNPTIYTFEYDNQNRIVRVTNNYNHSETQFSYSGNTVTETLIYTNGGFDTRICQLNADGYIESITDYQYPEDLQLYSYKNGYLQEMHASWSNDQWIYNWDNGNLISISEPIVWDTRWDKTITYSQVTAIPTNINIDYIEECPELQFFGFTGKQSKFLPKKSIHKNETDTKTDTYEYEFNSNGTISKILITSVRVGESNNRTVYYSIELVY